MDGATLLRILTDTTSSPLPFFLAGILVSGLLVLLLDRCPGSPMVLDDEPETAAPAATAAEKTPAEPATAPEPTSSDGAGGELASTDPPAREEPARRGPVTAENVISAEEEARLFSLTKALMPSAADEVIRKEIEKGKREAVAHFQRTGTFGAPNPREDGQSLRRWLDLLFLGVMVAIIAWVLSHEYKVDVPAFITKYFPREMAAIRGLAFQPAAESS